MNRDYGDGVTDDAQIFIGVEVENTPCKNMATLFVVGLHDTEKLVRYAHTHNIQHVYLGANMSFDGNNIRQWELMAEALLQKKFWVTLDFDIQHASMIVETRLSEYDCFIPMISVKLPYLSRLGYNACLKIDDKDFDYSNQGVWVHQLHDLLDRSKFTDWTKYTQDWVIERANITVDINTNIK
jgi:hypothetical protein